MTSTQFSQTWKLTQASVKSFIQVACGRAGIWTQETWFTNYTLNHSTYCHHVHMRVFVGLWREWSLPIDTHHFTSIKSLWKNTQQRGNISRLWGEMLRSHRGRKTNETLLCNHLQSKGKRMKYRSEMTFENNSPNEQFLSNSFPLSVPRQPRSSYMSARGSWEWALSQKQQSSHKKEVPQSPRFGVTRQGGFVAVFPLIQSP